MSFSSRDAMALSSGLACGGLFVISLHLYVEGTSPMWGYTFIIAVLAIALAVLSAIKAS